ncbi:hypothetical protein ACFL5V_05325 [Fibrobacterota bacterium]
MKNQYFSIFMILVGFLLTGTFAQYEETTTTDTETPTYGDPAPTPAYTPTPSYSSPTLSTSSTDLDPPRTPMYNGIMQNNPAAPFTTADYMLRPHIIGDQQYITGYSFGATNGNGAFSVKGMGMNWFGALAYDAPAVGPAVQLIRAGVATGVFGAGIVYELNKASTENVLGADTDQDLTYVGDRYGLFGSFNLAGTSLFAEIARRTYPNTYTNTQFPSGTLPDENVEEKSASTDLMVGWAMDAEEEGDHAVFTQLDISIAAAEDDRTTRLIDYSEQDIDFLAGWGVIMKKNDDYSVVGGVNLMAGRMASDDNIAPATEISDIDFLLAPDIAILKNLGKGFEASMGLSLFMLNYQSTTTTITLPAATTETVSSSLTTVDGANLGLGLRWKSNAFAFEGQVNPLTLAQGPDFISGAGTNNAASNLFYSVGIGVAF